ncbi:MAG: ABC transporter ATP-binding protein [Phycisphaerales bacterium]
MSDTQIRSVRGGDVAMIFQEPMTSLNPVYTVGEQLIEAVQLHQNLGRDAAGAAVVEAMTEVGIVNAAGRLDAYPHQFSGGMRQRVMIAMALACRPRVLLADEPTTALDVTVQAQILELLRSLQERRGLAIMLITHALGVVAQNADVVAVMYGGRIVEYARVDELFANPIHPYTRGLLASIPRTRARAERLTTIKELVERPSEFESLERSRGLRAWWPTHEPPAGIVPDSATGLSSVLTEINPGHWVCVWRSRGVEQLNAPIPTLKYRKPRVATAVIELR